MGGDGNDGRRHARGEAGGEERRSGSLLARGPSAGGMLDDRSGAGPPKKRALFRSTQDDLELGRQDLPEATLNLLMASFGDAGETSCVRRDIAGGGVEVPPGVLRQAGEPLRHAPPVEGAWIADMR